MLVFFIINAMSEYPDAVQDLNIYFRNIEYNDSSKELNLPAEIDENAWVEIVKDNKVVYIDGHKG